MTFTLSNHLLYEDEHFLVVNKPSGLLSVPGKIEALSLTDYVQQRYPEGRIVHRLDMATSGIILFARSLEVQKRLMKQFEVKRVSKRYTALVEGRLNSAQGSIDLPLLCDWPNRPRQHVTSDGKPSLTYFQVINAEEINTNEGPKTVTRVLLTPITGRSHQLRVHLSAMGYPIVGDEFYADEQTSGWTDRLCLHAEYIAFTHPVTEKSISFHSSAPF